jgi:hypothetical protein
MLEFKSLSGEMPAARQNTGSISAHCLAGRPVLGRERGRAGRQGHTMGKNVYVCA